MSRLKNLYKLLIENRKHEIESWHDAYEGFYSEVEDMRKRTESNNGLSPEQDKEFLKKLIYEANNGISTRGQSILSKPNFEAFIQERSFLSPLESFISKPTEDNFEEFDKAWRVQGKSNNPLLVNRVAAACTLSVSTTVDNNKFNKVFDWLTKEEIIPENPTLADGGWFAKNEFLMGTIAKEFESELQNEKTDKFYLNIFVWELYENIFEPPFSLKKQIVKYGAPGTGKTYKAHQETLLFFEMWKDEFAPNSSFAYEKQTEFVQFHPSFSYEDFMEGLRPVLDGDGTAQLKLQNGVFKQFCQEAGKWEIDIHTLAPELDWDLLKIEDLSDIKKKLSEKGEHWQHIFQVADHSKLVSDAVPPFFFIIDEVNRAELSRVFGELMYCLEYRGVKGKIKTQYAGLNNEKTGMLRTNQGYWFFIPTNVYLLGTMNTIDRSVESFDFALRRRFKWEEVPPDTKLLKYDLKKHCPPPWVALADDLETLNGKITNETLLGAEYQIGHAYLMNMKYSKDLKVEEVRSRIWDDSIRPLLQEYLRGTDKSAEDFENEFGLKN
ncbi:MAG: AAA family ATPase [Gammaproteobacteria bacterium]|nr:AAA family ATPase [Gammaproteobacteria bacterium]